MSRDDLIRRAGLSEQEKAIFLRIGLRSAICVPLIARGRTFGAISLAMAESRRRYDADDLRWRRISRATRRSRSTTPACTPTSAPPASRPNERHFGSSACSRSPPRCRMRERQSQVGEVIVQHGLDALGACRRSCTSSASRAPCSISSARRAYAADAVAPLRRDPDSRESRRRRMR